MNLERKTARYQMGPISILGWLVFLLALVALFQSTVVAGNPGYYPLAQFTSEFPEPEPGEAGLELWIKVVILMVIIFATYMTFYFIIFPLRLRANSPNGTWPMTMYGRCNAGAWLISVLAALPIFFNELEWDPDHPTALGQYGLRTGVAVVAIGGAFFWWFACRSQGERPKK